MQCELSMLSLTEEVIRQYSQDLVNIASDIPGEYWTIEHFIVPLKDKWKLSFCLLHENVPQGYVIASNRGGRAHIHHFMVHQNLRSRGWGAGMLAEVEKRAGKMGLRDITLKVSKENRRGFNFYSKHGFRVLDKNAGENGNYLLLGKELLTVC